MENWVFFFFFGIRAFLGGQNFFWAVNVALEIQKFGLESQKLFFTAQFFFKYKTGFFGSFRNSEFLGEKHNLFQVHFLGRLPHFLGNTQGFFGMQFFLTVDFLSGNFW